MTEHNADHAERRQSQARGTVGSPTPATPGGVGGPTGRPVPGATDGGNRGGVETVEQYGRFEVQLTGPATVNPFCDVDFGARFSLGNRSVAVRGFYDGEGRYIVRFMPDSVGTWHYTTTSTVAMLDGRTGSLRVVAPRTPTDNHGPVAAVGYGFAYADGTPFLPVGTTCYGWLHQPPAMRDRTIATLSGSPFTKIRMCVFPKHYAFNANEPDAFVFPGSLADGFDFDRFNPQFFAVLEYELERLAALHIEADLILFHPYDRWGFQDLPPAVEERYLRYVIARLAAYRNVWWSMANEWDFMAKKSVQDFHRYFQIVQQEDPYAHLRSVHNGAQIYDHALAWVTHASMQHSETDRCVEWREQYRKPVVIDECCYEGNISQAWGNISAQELMRRQWTALTAGGWPGAHGETYYNEREELWWSKGGELIGQAPDRLAFMRSVLADDPLIKAAPVRARNRPPYLCLPNEYWLYYFGIERPLWKNIVLPDNVRHHIEVIDTWNMTVTQLDGDWSGEARVPLPGTEYIAVRIRRAT